MVQRKKEMAQLQSVYEKKGSRLVIISGRSGAGKTTLLEEFTSDKKAYWYRAVECSDRQQKLLMQRAWADMYGLHETAEGAERARLSGIEMSRRSHKKGSYLSLFTRACAQASGEAIIVLDNFLQLAKNDNGIYMELIQLMKEQPSVMVVLISSTLNWREEEAGIEPRSFVSCITERIMVEPFEFLELVKFFPELPVGDIIQVYALMGGVPGYVKYWDVNKSVKENIIHLFVEKDAVLGREVVRYLRNTLRELSLYNTVLCSMTGGVTRLNDIFEATGFSRAKISVYMKNLGQLGVVSKRRVLSIRCKDQEIKGLYEITDPLIHFWYRFIYPNQSLLAEVTAEAFYDRMIRDELEQYTSYYFERVCLQYLELMNQYKKLPIRFDQMGSWYGKAGHIPFLAKDKEGRLLVMFGKWKEEMFTTADLEQILHYLVQIGVNPEYYFLFSKSDFHTELRGKADFIKNMFLVDLKDL